MAKAHKTIELKILEQQNGDPGLINALFYPSGRPALSFSQDLWRKK